MAFAAASQETAREPIPGVTVTLAGCPGGAALGVPVAASEAGPSAALARVAITCTVYSVPAVRPPMV